MVKKICIQQSIDRTDATAIAARARFAADATADYILIDEDGSLGAAAYAASSTALGLDRLPVGAVVENPGRRVGAYAGVMGPEWIVILQNGATTRECSSISTTRLVARAALGREIEAAS